ncbi:hypothetical protein O181_130169 [Austropuccinia psidii MF-1]|uniref:Uncharacterized protein n=1 Tax=Austropuccinia psidii MF-1 TaxID=1389203 RepID=A0A9Q3L3B3_9BASI|nr:hypothetical protein [Austropuccinia psidii MF-1]
MEYTLGGFGKQIIVPQSLEERGHMFYMFRLRAGKDHNIISINYNKDIIQKILERSRSIGKAKWHNQILITTIFGSKGSYMLIPFFDSQEIICTMQSYLGKDSGTVDYGKNLVHRRNRIPVLPGDSI